MPEPLADYFRPAVATTTDSLKRTARELVERLPAPIRRKIWDLRAPKGRRGFDPPTRIAATVNVAYNREIWDWYAERWSDPEFRAEQLHHEGRSGTEEGQLARLGEEWGRLDDAVQVIEEWILPHVAEGDRVGEIGTGGGRVATRVAPKVGAFDCFDVSEKMLELVRKELEGCGATTRYHHLPAPRLPAGLTNTFDFFYSFDVFVHIDLHTQWRYIAEIARVLKPGAKGFLHTSNLTAEAGWQRFVEQPHYRVEGFYFTTPQAVRTLVERAGMVVLEEHDPKPGNFYYERDHLVLFQKPAS